MAVSNPNNCRARGLFVGLATDDIAICSDVHDQTASVTEFALELSGDQFDCAVRAGDAGAELKTVTVRDGQIHSEELKDPLEFIRVGSRDFKSDQAQTGGRVVGRVGRISVPLDEDRQQAVTVVSQA